MLGLRAYLAPFLYLNDISQAAWATKRQDAVLKPKAKGSPLTKSANFDRALAALRASGYEIDA